MITYLTSEGTTCRMTFCGARVRFLDKESNEENVQFYAETITIEDIT